MDIALLAIEAADDAHAAHPDREWVIEVEESLEIIGDEHRLRQVLINLLSNVAAHTPKGTHANVSVKRDGEYARIVVADNGPGIDPKLLPRLFDRFTRGDRARNRAAGSTGLGLSIAHAIVQAHGGAIDVVSGAEGTAFTIHLPATSTDLTRD